MLTGPTMSTGLTGATELNGSQGIKGLTRPTENTTISYQNPQKHDNEYSAVFNNSNYDLSSLPNQIR